MATKRGPTHNLSSTTLEAEGLQGALGKLQGLNADQLAEIFPNVEGLRGVLPALANFDQFGEDLEATTNAAGATDAAFAKIAGSLSLLRDQLIQSGKVFLGFFGEAIAPDIKLLAGFVKTLTKNISGFTKANLPLIRTVGLIVAGIITAGAALTSLGVGVILTGALIGSLGTIIAGVITAVTATAAVISSVFGGAVAAAAATLAFLASPLGLVLVGVVALGAALIDFGAVAGTVSTGVQTAIGKAAEVFNVLKHDAVESFGAIKNALLAGDIAAASAVLFALLKLEWQRGVSALTGIFEGIKAATIEVGASALVGLLRTGNFVWSRLKDGIADLQTFVVSTFASIGDFMAKTINNSLYYIELAINKLKALASNSYSLEDAGREANESFDRRESEREQRSADGQQVINANSNADTSERRQKEEEISAYLDELRAGITQNTEADRAAAIAGAEQELGKARKNWNEAVADANKAKAEATKIEQEKEQQRKDINDSANDTAKATNERGEFGAVGSFSSNVGDRFDSITLSYQKKSLDYQKETARNTRDNGLVLG